MAATPPDVDGRFYGDGEDTVYVPLGKDGDRGTLWYYQDGSTLYLAMVVDEGVNENVFSPVRDYTRSALWSPGHDLDTLIGSDHFHFSLACNGIYYEWKQDYIYDNDPTAGFAWLSDTAGPDGSATDCTTCTGDPPGLVSASSLQWNLKWSTWDYDGTPDDPNTANWWSPYTEGIPYDVPNEDGYPEWSDSYQWEWAMVYEMSLDLGSACSGAPWVAQVLSAHNSPSKDSDEDITFDLYDYGDAPDPYPTAGTGAARHEIVVGGPILGFVVDAEADGQPDGSAALDDFRLWPGGVDDEDGLFSTPQLVEGASVTLVMSGTAGSLLDGWIDFNGDDDWDDAGEQIFASVALTGGWQNLPAFTVPQLGRTYTYGRFRVSDEGGLGPSGSWDNGEVEDYVFNLTPTAVDLASFGATAANGVIVVEWETVSEEDNLGFNLYRSESVAGPRVKVNGGLILSSVAPGSPLGATYRFADDSTQSGVTYYYWLEEVDVYGVSAFHGPVSAQLPMPLKWRILPVRPRPYSSPLFGPSR
jgi:hypothetical protein